MQSGEMEQSASCIRWTGIRNNMISVFDSFICGQLSKNLVNTYSSNWFKMHTGVLQGSLFSPFILSALQIYLWRKKYQTQTMPKIINKTKIQENQNMQMMWSSGRFIQTFIIYLIATVYLQDWCSKWNISINSIKINCMAFYDKRNISGIIT